MTNSRFSCVGAGLVSVDQLPDLAKQAARIRTLCLHGNRIVSLQGIQALHSLTDVNLSSNELRNIDSLQTLTALTSVNLASNRLQGLEGLLMLPSIQRLTASHNMIVSLAPFAQQAACRHSLKHLDLQNNQISSLDELAALKFFPNLRQLKIAGGYPENPACSRPGFQQHILQMLPQLETLDGQPCDKIPAQHWPVIKAQQQLVLPPFNLHFQQQQPVTAGPLVLSTDAHMHHLQPLPLPAPHQQARPISLPAGPGPLQVKAAPPLTFDLPQSQGQAQGQNQDARIAALESRLREVVGMRSRPPLAPTENLLHQQLAVRKTRSKAVMHEVACQTATSMVQLDRLNDDATHLKEELQSLVTELDSRTSHALQVEEQAGALLQEAEQQAEQRVSSLNAASVD